MPNYKSISIYKFTLSGKISVKQGMPSTEVAPQYGDESFCFACHVRGKILMEQVAHKCYAPLGAGYR